MAKRVAERELTDRNWDEEEEVEEAGEFAKASNDTMQKRQIIKAKRRGPSEGGSTSFSGFGGFSFKPTQTSTPFSFNVKSFTNGKSETNSEKSEKQSEQTSESKEPNGEVEKEEKEADEANNKYMSNLRNLNESVLAWIKKHVEKNPYCILTPIFQDYEKHLKDIEKDKKDVSKSPAKETSQTGSFLFTNDKKVSFPSKSDDGAAKSESNPPNTGLKSDDSAAKSGTSSPPKTGFKFDVTGASVKAASTASSGFSFGSTVPGSSFGSAGFTFAVGNASTSTGGTESNKAEGDDEEYVPPKVESKEIAEEGSLFSIKCKLFYQKDGNWTERGVGFLHLKKSDGKTQLVVRADTTLGNILLNIILSQSIPLKRQGKNNINMICAPNPLINPKDDPAKPVAMLIRVKTGEDADSLLEKMEELRKE